MALSPGSRIGSYEIGAQIGAGGMGEVYRATDTRLHRDVAIKVLPDALAGNTDRLARFQREAEVLASLNHPNIAHVYGVEGDAGATALVMELVEGPTLSDRLRDGPLSLDQASAIARQIADALEYAHERGVIHRDLKPANVKVRPDGTVKVLDFGLAKGQEVDRRADIWAFGCLFYEMLAGIPPHRQDTSQETLASILRDAPDLSRVPAQSHRLLRRCLEKDPQRRLRHIGDVMSLLDEPPSGEHAPPAPSGIGAVRPTTSRPTWLWPAVAGVAVLAGAVALVVWVTGRGGTEPTQSVRFEVGETDEMRFFFGGAMAVSPDGRWLVFPATGADGVNRYYLRSLETVEARALPGTEGAYVPAAWTADSRYVIFTVIGGTELQRVDIQGGPPQTLATLPAGTTNINGATSNQNEIVFASAAPNVPLRRVPIAGGALAPVTALLDDDTSHQFPQFLPDGRRFLYFVASNEPDRMGMYVGSLDVAPDAQRTERLLATDRQAYHASPTGAGPGHLITLRGTTLLAQPFDADRLELSGEPMPIAQDVDSFTPRNYGLFTVSDSGALVYRGGAGSGLSVVSFDEAGRPDASFGEPDVYRQPTVSPDGTRVAVTRGADGTRDVWVIDIARDTT